jgi:hypothetical protein
MIVVPRVHALRPLMEVAGVDVKSDAVGEDASLRQATAAGIRHTVDVATTAMASNYTRQLIAAITFVRTNSIPYFIS